MPVEGHLGRRPRLHLRGEPPLPAQGRRELYDRGEAALPAPPTRRPPCHGRAATRTSRGTSRSRKCGSQTTSGSSSASTPRPPNATPPSAPRMIARLEEAIRNSDQAEPRQARGAARRDLHQARTEPLPARHPGRPAPHRRGEGEGRGEPRREVPAQDRGPEAVRRGHRRRLQAAPGSRARLARHEAGHRPAPGLPRREDRIRAHVACAGSPSSWPASPRTPPARPGPSCAASSTASTSAPSPAPPAPFSSAPS